MHDPAMLVNVFEGDEAGAMGLPCWGWFDDCDDVLAILRGIKKRVETPGATLPLFKPDLSKNRGERYVALEVEIEGEDFERIIIENEIKADKAVDPKTYYDFNRKENNRFQAGFMFKAGDNSLFNILIANEDDSLTTISKVETLRKYLFGNIKSVGSEKNQEELFLENVQWVSQSDESIFGQCSGCWPSACCRRAAEYMMGNTAVANCSDTTIAQTSSNLSVIEKIITANFSNNSINYTTTTYNSTILSHDLSKAKLAASYIEERLAAGKPVLIGVHYTNGTWNPPNNANRATRHYMVIVGTGSIDGKTYFRFYDPGRSVELMAEATSVNNKLIFEKNESCIKGNYNGKVYTISEVLKTN